MKSLFREIKFPVVFVGGVKVAEFGGAIQPVVELCGVGRVAADAGGRWGFY